MRHSLQGSNVPTNTYKNQAIAKGIQNIDSIDKSLRLMVLLFGCSMYKYINEKFLYS